MSEGIVVKSSTKEEYDKLVTEYKSNGYTIVERGSEVNGDWYFKCHKK